MTSRRPARAHHRHHLPVLLLAFATLGACAGHRDDLGSHVAAGNSCTGTCGDTAGDNGDDVRCCCGDQVVTDTVLTGDDPVVQALCPGDGLRIGHKITLDLGGFRIEGEGVGTGIEMPSAGRVENGDVVGFHVGVSISDAEGGGDSVLTGMLIGANGDDGVQIELEDPGNHALLSGLSVRSNGEDGVNVISAPGLSNLEDKTAVLAPGDAGVTVNESTLIHGNGGHGLRLGGNDQPADVSVILQDIDVVANGRAGVFMEQHCNVLPGDDCGDSADQPGCTGVAMQNVDVRENAGPGVRLRTAFLIPLASVGRGFVGNRIHHNAMPSSGCTATTTGQQVLIEGPVALANPVCATATTFIQCMALPVNEPCAWTGSACKTAWLLRGSESAAPQLNRFFAYKADPGDPILTGVRAENGAVVNVRNDIWGPGGPEIGATADANSAVDTVDNMGTISTCP